MQESLRDRIIFLEQRLQTLIDQITKPGLTDQELKNLQHEIIAASHMLLARREALEPE